MKDIKIKRVRQVVPEIKELTLDEPEERHLVAELGTLERDKPTRYILDLSLPKRPDGKFVIAEIEITYDLGTGKRETTGPGAAGDDVHVGGPRLRQRRGGQAHRRGADLRAEQEPASRRIADERQGRGASAWPRRSRRRRELMGPRAAKKTMLAKQVLAGTERRRPRLEEDAAGHGRRGPRRGRDRRSRPEPLARGARSTASRRLRAQDGTGGQRATHLSPLVTDALPADPRTARTAPGPVFLRTS